MKKHLFLFLSASSAVPAFADVIASQPTGEPALDYTLLIIGGLAIVALLVVRMVRKRKQM